MNKPFGLRQQIVESQSVEEINILLSKSKTFDVASERTRRSWKYTTKRALHRLSQPEVKKTEVKKSNDSNVKGKNYQKSK